MSSELNSPFPERSIRTFDDWRAFVLKDEPTRPKVPTRTEYEAMTKVERKLVNSARVHYNNAFGPALVPNMKRIISAGIDIANINRGAKPGARPGLIINGDSTIGKSTIAMQLGKKYETLLRKHNTITKTPSGHTFIPVAFINLPATMAIMDFNHLLATYYNIPFKRSATASFLTDAIKEAAADCATSMFILDDIHFLKIHNRTHEYLNNHIKTLANSISATFVYAGIDLENTGLLTEGKSAEKGGNTQTGHRFKMFDLQAFHLASVAGQKNMISLLGYFEDNFLLYNQESGDLYQNFAQYIMDRTGGFIGPIVQLLREAAMAAISNGDEKFTMMGFSKIKLDHDSEASYKQIQKNSQAKANQSRAAA